MTECEVLGLGNVCGQEDTGTQGTCRDHRNNNTTGRTAIEGAIRARKKVIHFGETSITLCFPDVQINLEERGEEEDRGFLEAFGPL